MGQREPRKTTNLATLYDQELMPWSRAAEALGTGSLGPEPACFLGTVRPDGRPHAAGVGADNEGGWPAQVADDAITAPYSAQSAGPSPWHLYRFRIRTAFGVGTRPPHGASRWDF